MRIFCIAVLGSLLWGSSIAFGQDEVGEKYRRSSLYTLLIQHPERSFGAEIASVFRSIPVPDKFNEHDLNRKILNSILYNKNVKEEPKEITAFLNKNAIARRLVAKWFCRDKRTGAFDMHLIEERGCYDASYFDVKLSKLSVRGKAQLADAGEELIGNTFVLVNDIYYVDKEARAAIMSGIFGLVGQTASSFNGSVAETVESAADLGKNIADMIAGFRVIVVSHLYRLNWDEETMTRFYENYYMSDDIDEKRKKAFDMDKTTFSFVYVGSQIVDSQKTSIKGVNTDTPEEMIRKVCTRALDKSIAELQQNHEVFRVKTPLYAVDGKTIKAKIGMKEGVDSDSKFEVLERIENEKGRTEYRRVGMLKPVSGKIWDNRYMAMEEGSEEANLGATEFRQVSGGELYPGLLIREVK